MDLCELKASLSLHREFYANKSYNKLSFKKKNPTVLKLSGSSNIISTGKSKGFLYRFFDVFLKKNKQKHTSFLGW